MTDAMQITVSNDMEKRIEDKSSTDARHTLEPLANSMPSVETVMEEKIERQKKGSPSSDGTAQFGVK